MKEIEKVVSENIQKIIKEYNLTHQDLATIAGVSVSTVGKWILEKASPRMGAIEKISNHFQIPKSYILKEDDYELPNLLSEYKYYPAYVSAGIPDNVEGITEYETISIADEMMGKYANNKDIYFIHVNGESMNKIIPHDSLVAVRPVSSTHDLKSDDIVVYRKDNEYAIKRYIKHQDKVIFRPESNDNSFTDDVVENEYLDNVVVKGKVVLYIVELDWSLAGLTTPHIIRRFY